jgi:putative flippase GtrA
MTLAEKLSRQHLKSYFAGASHRTKVQFFRYAFVAVAAFIVDFGCLAILASGYHVNYLLAAAFAFMLGLITNYVLSVKWVFSAYNASNRTREFIIFALVGLVGLGLTEILLWFFTESFNIHYLASKLLTAFIVVIWNFTARKLLLYR